MKRSDINKVFNQKVLEYMMNGYIINTETMSGSQGEEGKVDLLKGDTLVRVWLDREHHLRVTDDWSGVTLVLRVGKWKYKMVGSYDTAWMKDFDILDEIKFYDVSRDDKWYTDNLEDALDSMEKNSSRTISHRKSRATLINDEWAKDIAVKYLKRKLGYKRVCRDNVRVFRKDNKYYVGYNLQNYELR